MSQQLADLLNLELAWARVLFDRPDRCFLSYPFVLELVELDRGAWLERIRQRVIQGYGPSSSAIVQVPKGHWQVRPGASLRLEDEVIFNALLGLNLGEVQDELRTLQGDPDVAYQLPDGLNRREWVHRGSFVWQEFREKSRARVEAGAQYVLFTDISAFYENIDLPRLSSEIRRLRFDPESAQLLSECLNRWAQPRGKGIPQGYTAADLLAKIYLSSCDHNFRNDGFDHLRYVDDIRVFCRNFQEAQKAILRLTELLRVIGLNLQTAKTVIRSADDALLKIDGVKATITGIHTELLEAVGGAYGTIADLERAVELDPGNASVEVLEIAFVENFLEGGREFDKSLFHFLLTRLGTTHSRIAIDYCLTALSSRPEETADIVAYFEKIELQREQHDRIVEFLNSDAALYDYQNCLLLKYYFDIRHTSVGILAICRRYLRDRGKPDWLKAYASALLGMNGDAADMQFFEELYATLQGDVEKAVCICSSAGMETRRRNEFMGRVRRDGDLEERAARWVRARHP